LKREKQYQEIIKEQEKQISQLRREFSENRGSE
jgi:hypothetical protein